MLFAIKETTFIHFSADRTPDQISIMKLVYFVALFSLSVSLDVTLLPENDVAVCPFHTENVIFECNVSDSTHPYIHWRITANNEMIDVLLDMSQLHENLSSGHDGITMKLISINEHMLSSTVSVSTILSSVTVQCHGLYRTIFQPSEFSRNNFHSKKFNLLAW